MTGNTVAVELGVQLAAAGGLVIVTALVHGLGMEAMAKLYGLEDRKLEEREFDARAVMLMGAIALTLFLLHTLHIGLYAIFYLAVGEAGTAEEALFHSASAYATLGYADQPLGEWRLMAAFEGLVGFLMLGWSTAFLVHNIDRLRAR